MYVDTAELYAYVQKRTSAIYGLLKSIPPQGGSLQVEMMQPVRSLGQNTSQATCSKYANIYKNIYLQTTSNLFFD